MTLAPPPKHLIGKEAKYVRLWYAAQLHIFRNCGLRPAPRRGKIELVCMEKKATDKEVIR